MRLALPLPLLLLTLGLGCADPPTPAAPKTPPKAREPSELAILSEPDCRSWANHFASRLREATRRRIAECDKRLVAAGGSPMTTNAKDLAVTEAEADRLHDLIVTQCSEQVGASYPRADAQCYLGKKALEGWKECHFHSAFFADYKSIALNHEHMFDERCQSALEKLSP